jgi:zinc protease
MIKNGAAFDPVGKWGSTHLMVHSMMGMTERRGGDKIREDLASMNAEIEVRVDWDAIFFEGSAPANRIADTLEVLAEIVTKPRFEEKSFEELRAAWIKRVSEESEQIGRRTQLRFIGELFQENPYGHSVEGSVETLTALSLNDLKIQYRRLLMPNQAQLALEFSGDVAKLFRGMGRSWGGWVRGDAVPFTFRQAGPIAGTRILLLDWPQEEALLRFGSLSVVKGSADFYTLKVLEHYLTLCLPDWADQVASDSQIQAVVSLEARKMPGYLQLSLKAPATLVAAYVQKIRDVLERLRSGEIDPDRFKESKELALLELRESLSRPLPRLYELLRANLYDLGLRYVSAFGPRLDRVHPAQVQSVLLHHLSPDSLLMVVAGPAAQIGPQFDKFGTVEILN